MKPFLLIIFLSATQFILKAQNLDRKFLDDKVKKIDTANKFKADETVYVVNGISFTVADSVKLDSTLNSHNVKYLVNLDFLNCATTNLVPCYKPVVLVTFAYNQKLKKKRTLWRKVNNSFNDKYFSFSQHIFNDAQDPVLYIDNILIHHTEVKTRIKALNLKAVYYIDYNNKPAQEELYGQNAKNGLVRIWTVPK